MRSMVAVLVPLVGVCFAAVLVAQEASMAGHWEGANILVPAEQEVDVVVDFNATAGQIKGQLKFPVTSDGTHEVEDLHVEGSHVSFTVHDSAGVISAFDGTLSPDGASLQGTMKESGRVMSFTLHRVKEAPTREVSIHKLVGNGAELINAFNADVGNVRMLLLLNPISFPSRVELRIVERFVMDQISDSKLRVYVVWIAPDKPELMKVIQRLAGLAPDPRITHFWSTDRSLLNVLEPILALYKPITNPCMLFGPDRSWAASPPLPDRFRQSAKIGDKNQADPLQRLNGIELAAEVRRFLETTKSHQ
ncbi:MAG TPA: hypothetical protein VF173_25900 [Thermoanaerobaculia bacterium]|nr:hypothetical protein [Thermoanaerobaculia bacterium]